MLLDELRWEVLVKECKLRSDSGKRLNLNKSYRESWRQTFDRLNGFLKTQGIGRPLTMDPQIVARSAAFRLHDPEATVSLLSDSDAACEIKTHRTRREADDNEKPLPWSASYRPVGFIRCLFAWTNRRGEAQDIAVFMPQSRKILVVLRPGDDVGDLRRFQSQIRLKYRHAWKWRQGELDK